MLQECRRCGAERTSLLPILNGPMPSTSMPSDPPSSDHTTSGSLPSSDALPSDTASAESAIGVEPAEEAAPQNPDGPRPIAAILADLKRPLRARHLLAKPDGRGGELTYCPWHRVARYLTHYTRGWWSKDVQVTTTAERIFVTVTITIQASDGRLVRSATGTERLFDVKDGEPREIPYGDPSSNAESQAFRRACANFGLGLDLYEG
jgi:hypothetical protein